MSGERDSKKRRSGEINLPKLELNRYPSWKDTIITLMNANNLLGWIDGTATFPAEPNYTLTRGGDKTTKDLILEGDYSKKLLKAKEECSLSFNLIYETIPEHFQRSWSKGTSTAKELIDKIEDMINHQQDHLQKQMFKNEFEQLKLKSDQILGINKYKTKFLDLVNEIELAGGTVLEEDKVGKLQKDLLKFKTLYEAVFNEICREGPNIGTYSSTNGWNILDLFKVITQRTNLERTAKMLSNKSTEYNFEEESRKSGDRDYNNSNRKPLRSSMKNASYDRRDNPRKFQNEQFRRSKDTRNNFKPYRSNNNFKQKRYNPYNNNSESDNKEFVNNVSDTIPKDGGDSSKTRYPNAMNYQVQNKQKNKQVSFQGKKKNNHSSNGGAYGPKEYTNPLCSICGGHHYTNRCGNYEKNKDAKPSEVSRNTTYNKTMSIRDNNFDYSKYEVSNDYASSNQQEMNTSRADQFLRQPRPDKCLMLRNIVPQNDALQSSKLNCCNRQLPMEKTLVIANNNICSMSIDNPEDLGLVDCGSTSSHAFQKHHFDSIDQQKISSTELANGEIVHTGGEGRIGNHIVNFTPSFNQNIVAVNTLTENDDVVCFSKSRGAFVVREIHFDFDIPVKHKLIKQDRMYYMRMSDLKDDKEKRLPSPIHNLTMAAVPNTHPLGSIILWHQRLHMSYNYIKRLYQLQLVEGLHINDYDMKRQLAVCESCMYSKFTRNTFFKKYQVERSERYKITRREMKEFNSIKDSKPFSTQPEKFYKYPDEPLPAFDSYSKHDISMESENNIPEFIKVKFNPLQNNLTGELYKTISVDIKGPFNISGFSGERYLIAFIDCKASMQSELYFLESKSAPASAKALESYIETVILPNCKTMEIHFEFSIMHSDNGSEFQKDFKTVCKRHNLKQTFSVANTPEQNSVVERYWRSLMGPVLAFLFSSKLNKKLWPFCCSFVNEVILNKLRIITYKGNVTTTYQVINNHKPNIGYLRTWGCEVFALDERKYDPRHFTEKSFKGYFVGYDRDSKSILVYDPLNDEIIHTVHLK